MLLERNELLDEVESMEEYKNFSDSTKKALKEQWEDLIYSWVVILILNSLFKWEEIRLPNSMVAIARLKNIITSKVKENINSLSKYQELSIKTRIFLTRLANIWWQYELNNFLHNVSFNLTNRFYRDKIKDRVNSLITWMDEYSIKRFTSELIKSISKAKTKKDVIKSLEDSWKEIAKIRADNVMRTETSTMLEYMRLQVWILNWVQYKQWKAILDERTCPICMPLHNQVARIDEWFPSWYYAPWAHSKCRCTMVLSWDITEFWVQKKYEFYGKDNFQWIILNRPNINYYWTWWDSFKWKEANKIQELYNELIQFSEDNIRWFLSWKKWIEVYSIYSLSKKIEYAKKELTELSFNSLMFLLTNRWKTKWSKFLNY